MSQTQAPAPPAGYEGKNETSILEEEEIIDDLLISKGQPPVAVPSKEFEMHPKHDGVHYTFFEREAMRMARWPKTYFWVAFLVALVLSVIGFVVGNFSIANQNGGWQSRGTPIADRQTQIMLVTLKQKYLHDGGDAAWEDLTDNVQSTWQTDDSIGGRRLAVEEEEEKVPMMPSLSFLEEITPRFDFDFSSTRAYKPTMSIEQFLYRRLQQNTSARLAGCDTDWYTDGRMTNGTRLWPVWKTKKASSALDATALQELCEAEEQTQRILEEKGLCFGCDSQGKCLPPYGIVMYARLMIPDGMTMDCAHLANAWSSYQSQVASEWVACVDQMEQGGTTEGNDKCPEYFHPALVDEFIIDHSGQVQYSSSIFATTEAMAADLYNLVGDFGHGGGYIEAAYDTNNQDFDNIMANGAVSSDMILATGSAVITTLAMLVHTRSPFLTLVGLVQIILSFPLAYFVYRFICGLEYFPFLNFIGVFVVFALGADHVFVAVDKWKNARNDHPEYTAEQVAAKALPSAATAMFLTTSTTAAAFFGTAICPVAPVKLFSIFCGLLIVFDYVMDVLLIFPCLCIYDGYRENTNCCITIQRCRCRKSGDDDGHEGKEPQHELQNQEQHIELNDDGEAREVTMSLIRRILFAYYNFLHRFRWPLFAAITIAFATCCYFASRLRLPLSADVRLLKPSVEYERSYHWRLKLFSEELKKKEGSLAFLLWGSKPADTGDHSNPESWSTLVLDDTFDPSTPEAQTYMVKFCSKFFAEDFAGLPTPGWDCPINRFDQWLGNQTQSTSPENLYTKYCGGASKLPMKQDDFHACFSAWSQLMDETSVLSRDGVVELMFIPFKSRVRYDSLNSELDSEWHLIEGWLDDIQSKAPDGVNKAFFSSQDFWWYDTNHSMFSTAYGSAAIALAGAALVILISSKSFVMTIFSVTSICYVLASVTSMMVAAGWTLGFLESICFAILIGISVDFVIHFSHAYASIPGEASRESRTKYALIDMGPSILAAAFTTMAGAAIMLACVITFFTKFAMILFFTIVQSMLGSFVVFLTLTDCIGPIQPTYWADRIAEKFKGNESGSGDKEVSFTREFSEPSDSTDKQEEPQMALLPPTEFEV